MILQTTCRLQLKLALCSDIQGGVTIFHVIRIKREERVERQQEQLRKKNDDIEEWRRELTAFRKQVGHLCSRFTPWLL